MANITESVLNSIIENIHKREIIDVSKYEYESNSLYIGEFNQINLIK